MKTTSQEVHEEVSKLAFSIQTENEPFGRAYERASNLFRIIQVFETGEFMSKFSYQPPVCKSEVYDPDMFGYMGGYEGETQFIDDTDEEA